MSFYIDNYSWFLLVELFISFLIFRIARKGNLTYAEGWQFLFSLLLFSSSLFIVLSDKNSFLLDQYDKFTYFYLGILISFMLPLAYLVIRIVISPILLIKSKGQVDKTIDKIYLGPLKIIKVMYEYIALFSILIFIFIVMDTVENFHLWKTFSGVSIIISSAGLFWIRKTLIAETLNNIAARKMFSKDLKGCNELLQRSLLYRRNLPKTWILLVENHREMKDYGRSLKYLKYLKRLKKRSLVSGIIEAKLFYQMEKYSHCVKVCRRYLKTYDYSKELLELAVSASVKLKEYQQARSLFESYRTVGGKAPEILAYIVEAFYKLKEYQLVVDLFGNFDFESSLADDELMQRTKNFYRDSMKRIKT